MIFCKNCWFWSLKYTSHFLASSATSKRPSLCRDGFTTLSRNGMRRILFITESKKIWVIWFISFYETTEWKYFKVSLRWPVVWDLNLKMIKRSQLDPQNFTWRVTFSLNVYFKQIISKINPVLVKMAAETAKLVKHLLLHLFSVGSQFYIRYQ